MAINKFSVGCCCNPCVIPETVCYDVLGHEHWVNSGQATFYPSTPTYLPTTLAADGSIERSTLWNLSDQPLSGAGWYSCLVFDHTCSVSGSYLYHTNVYGMHYVHYTFVDDYYRCTFLDDGLLTSKIAQYLYRREWSYHIEPIIPWGLPITATGGGLWLNGFGYTFQHFSNDACASYSCDAEGFYLFGTGYAGIGSIGAGWYCCPAIDTASISAYSVPWEVGCSFTAFDCDDTEAPYYVSIEFVDCDTGEVNLTSCDSVSRPLRLRGEAGVSYRSTQGFIHEPTGGFNKVTKASSYPLEYWHYIVEPVGKLGRTGSGIRGEGKPYNYTVNEGPGG